MAHDYSQRKGTTAINQGRCPFPKRNNPPHKMYQLLDSFLWVIMIPSRFGSAKSIKILHQSSTNWFIHVHPILHGFQHVSTIHKRWVQDFATINSVSLRWSRARVFFGCNGLTFQPRQGRLMVQKRYALFDGLAAVRKLPCLMTPEGLPCFYVDLISLLIHVEEDHDQCQANDY